MPMKNFEHSIENPLQGEAVKFPYLNKIIDYCNELERRLAEVEKPKRNYLSDDYTLCVRCNNIHHKDIECNNQ